MGLITVEVFVEDLPITPTLMWRGIPLFDVGDAIRLVDYCKNNNIAVLGVEGFKIKVLSEKKIYLICRKLRGSFIVEKSDF